MAGVYFDTSVWSPIDLLSLYHLVSPEQVVYASDYPYGQQPSSLLIALRTARLAGLRRRASCGRCSAGTANRIADGEPPLEPSAPIGSTTFSQPMAFARIHQYLSMATPLLWTRQADTIGVLGLALNACDDRDGHQEARDADPRADRGRARPLAGAAGGRGRGRAAGRQPDDVSARPPGGHPGGDVRCLSSQVNGAVLEADPPVGRTLAETLRDDLGLTGTKIACGEGHCGACTVQLDGVPVLSCITLVHTVGEREVTTIEGLRDHALVDAFVRADALQCGFCTPGQIVSAAALVEAEPNPTPERVRHAMAGNLCRCGAYPRIEEAVLTWRD